MNTQTVKFQSFTEIIKFQKQISAIVNSEGIPMFTTSPNFKTKTIIIIQIRENKNWLQWLNSLPTDKYFTLGQYNTIQVQEA